MLLKMTESPWVHKIIQIKIVSEGVRSGRNTLPFKSWFYDFFFNLFERSLLCSPREHLFDQKYNKTVILWNIITIYNNFFFK